MGRVRGSEAPKARLRSATKGEFRGSEICLEIQKALGECLIRGFSLGGISIADVKSAGFRTGLVGK